MHAIEMFAFVASQSGHLSARGVVTLIARHSVLCLLFVLGFQGLNLLEMSDLDYLFQLFLLCRDFDIDLLLLDGKNPTLLLQVYYVYGFMLLVFLILAIVTVCVTIVGTYFLLNAENYHWQWTSFISAASTGAYVFLYSIYYYFMKTKMTGFFQTCFYFGYTLMFCIGLGILCGAVGYLGSSVFVRRIYRNIKCD
jgi:hypothetical protein